MVELVETITEVRDQVAQWRNEGLTVGLVPTMGKGEILNGRNLSI